MKDVDSELIVFAHSQDHREALAPHQSEQTLSQTLSSVTGKRAQPLRASMIKRTQMNFETALPYIVNMFAVFINTVLLLFTFTQTHI